MSWPLSLFVKIDHFLIGSSADKTEGAKAEAPNRLKGSSFTRNILNGQNKADQKKNIKPIARSKKVYFRAKMQEDV